jgi:UDP-glucose 4-epimerase
MKRQVLITGGFGYLGGRAAQLLAKRDDLQVTLGTRELRQAPGWLPEAKTAQLDWASDASLAAQCSGVETILHLAAMNENDCASDPVEALISNGVSTARLLRAAIAAGVHRFIYLSTAHIYGSALTGKVTEDRVPRPHHPYATSHRAGEDCVLAAHDRRTITGCVLRLSNAFGAPVHPGVNRWTLLVNDLCRQAVQQKRLVLHSAGQQVRDFVTLHDAARALSHSIDMSKNDVGDGIFNVGGECSMRVIDVAREVSVRCAAVLGFPPELHHPTANGAELEQPYEYNIDKFKKTGFILAGSRQEEIDNTLLLCQAAFSVGSVSP